MHNKPTLPEDVKRAFDCPAVQAAFVAGLYLGVILASLVLIFAVCHLRPVC